jgi:hypothetical protein
VTAGNTERKKTKEMGNEVKLHVLPASQLERRLRPLAESQMRFRLHLDPHLPRSYHPSMPQDSVVVNRLHRRRFLAKVQELAIELCDQNSTPP